MATDPASHITRGALAAIFERSQEEISRMQPVFQCLQIKPLAGASNQERFRVVFSDISNYVQSMLATQANHIIHEGKLKKGCLARIVQFQANHIKGKKILIILDIEILENVAPCEKIGDPQPLELDSESKDSATPKASEVGSTIQSNTFYGKTATRTQQPQRAQIHSILSGSSTSGHGTIYPIESVSPYAHKWTIKARCTQKSEIRTWQNKNGVGKLFSVNLLDDSGEIRATGFNDQVDQLYDIFQEGLVYYISSPCRVSFAKKQFSNVNNDYELMFERDTIVEKADEQDGVPQMRFNFTPIGSLQEVEKDTTIDVIGVLKEASEVGQIVSKTTQKPYDKRDLTIVDRSGYSVRLTIWGKTATAFNVEPGNIMGFKGVKVSDFNGRSLSLLSNGTMTVNPDIEEAHSLKGWYDAGGKGETFNSYSVGALGIGDAGGRRDPLKTINQIQTEQLGMNEEGKADYFTLGATILYIKDESPCYPACCSETCNKKVVEESDGWRCEKCNQTYPRPQYRYVMTVNVSDHTGQLWLNVFDDVGRMLMGMTADKLMELKESDEKAAADAFQEANCKSWIFKCRARMESFNDVQRVRYQVNSAAGIDFVNDGKKCAEMIKQYYE